jgi:(1->4)-alpha-D-glucan 1-alpha-D-glucosylmutase
MTRPVVATYRLQLRPDFGLAEAAGVVPYLARLGVSHLYLSPIFEAVTGSQHGYDVVDPTRVRGELGGRAAFDSLVRTARTHGLGLIIDIVPHHMAANAGNAWWWDVLARGQQSSYAHHFDIDWSPPEARLAGKVLLPVLGDHYGRMLEAGELRLDRRDEGGEVIVRYHEHLAPLSPDTAPEVPDDATLAFINADADRLDGLLERQHHRFARWQAAQELDYRRFFDIDSLVALRSEHDDVFADTHRLVLELVRNGDVDGLRIAHIDGLRVPAGYLSRLREEAPEAWIVVEKILSRDEELAPAWPVDGTTGYEFLSLAGGLLVDPAGWSRLRESYQRVTADDRTFEQVSLEARREMLEQSLGSDLARVVALWRDVCDRRRRWRDYTRAELHDALVEVAVHTRVYRAYVRAEAAPTAFDERVVEDALEAAAKARPDLDTELLDALRSVLLVKEPGDDVAAVAERFQQLTSPLAAKGEEDTALYRWVPYLAANEVGGHPAAPAVDPATFHTAQQRAHVRWPTTLLTTSTHDTKRSEDVRARLAVLTERPDSFVALVERLGEAHGGAIDRRAQWFVLQTIVGAHPLPFDRARDVVVKSLREAKDRTSWTRPDADYEREVVEFTERVLTDEAARAAIDDVVADLVEPGRVNSLTMLTLRTLAPGVPDTYQGTELWDDSLVDPDNRRPVDFARREAMLERVESRSVGSVWRDDRGSGLVKLALLRRLLTLRSELPAAFGERGSYTALGTSDDRVVAFIRGDPHSDAVAVAVPRLTAAGLPDGVVVELPDGEWRSVLTDVVAAGHQPFGALRGELPVAVLVR